MTPDSHHQPIQPIPLARHRRFLSSPSPSSIKPSPLGTAVFPTRLAPASLLSAPPRPNRQLFTPRTPARSRAHHHVCPRRPFRRRPEAPQAVALALALGITLSPSTRLLADGRAGSALFVDVPEGEPGVRRRQPTTSPTATPRRLDDLLPSHALFAFWPHQHQRDGHRDRPDAATADPARPSVSRGDGFGRQGRRSSCPVGRDESRCDFRRPSSARRAEFAPDARRPGRIRGSPSGA